MRELSPAENYKLMKELEAARAARRRKTAAAAPASQPAAAPAPQPQETAEQRAQREAAHAHNQYVIAVCELCRELGNNDIDQMRAFIDARMSLADIRAKLEHDRMMQRWDDALAAAQAAH